MDRSFGNQGDKAGQNPQSPATYAVNVNRSKTRKWVEAKVQSYDGDDWGAESDEEPDSPPLPPQQLAVNPLAVHAPRLPSETRNAGGSVVPPYRSATGSPSIEPPHPLRSHQPQNQSHPSSATRTSPVVTGPSSFGSPAEQPPAQPVPPQPVAPTDQSSAGWRPVDPEPPASQSQSNVSELSEEAGGAESKRLSVSPQLPDVARMSTFGVDMFGPSNFTKPVAEGSVIREECPEKKMAADLDTIQETTPTFANQGVKPSDGTGADVESEEPAMLRRPSLPGQWVTETPSVHIEPSEDEGRSSPAKTDPPEVSPISEHATLSSQGTSDRQDRTMLAHADPRMLPPLRTPSPHEPRTVGSPVVEQPAPEPVRQYSPDKPTVDITPTEPLQPKKPERSPSDYEPQPLTRPPTFSTVTSSPVKESDVLSDEIMRTLTPGGLSPSVNPDENRKSLSPGGNADVRASSYTLSAYDSYWAATGEDGEKSPVVVQPPVPTIPEEVVADKSPTVTSPQTQPLHVTGPISSPPVTSPVDSTGGSSHLRRRFSWEADESGAGPSQPAAAVSSVAAPIASPPITSPTSPTSDYSQEGRKQTFSTILQVSESGSVSHQVSKASTHKSSNEPVSAAEPSSPTSATDAVHTSPPAPLVIETKDQAPAVEDTHHDAISSSGLEPVSATPSIAVSAGKGPPALAFKEIMDLGSVSGRISKFKETQAIFANQDSGLNNWIVMMRSEHPEHAQANGSFSGSGPALGLNAAAAAPHGTAEKPYYQQYLNANSTGSNSQGSARSRFAALPAQAQAAGSAFGHSSGQIGHKSKEFMQSAGKMGKGLFSKGRSKLRGTGDKDDEEEEEEMQSPEAQANPAAEAAATTTPASTPLRPSQIPAHTSGAQSAMPMASSYLYGNSIKVGNKADRRASWGIGFGKSRMSMEGAVPQASGANLDTSIHRQNVPGPGNGPGGSLTSRISTHKQHQQHSYTHSSSFLHQKSHSQPPQVMGAVLGSQAAPPPPSRLPPLITQPPVTTSTPTTTTAPTSTTEPYAQWQPHLYSASEAGDAQRRKLYEVAYRNPPAPSLAKIGSGPSPGNSTAPRVHGRHASDGWVTVSRPAIDTAFATLKRPFKSNSRSSQLPRAPLAAAVTTPIPRTAMATEDSGIALASASGSQSQGQAQGQAQAPPNGPKRESSFKGLPEIIRSSSFGLTPKATRRSSGRFSLDDDDEAGADAVTRFLQGSPLSGTDDRDTKVAESTEPAMAPVEDSTRQSVGVDSNATLVGQESTGRTGRSSISVSKEPARFSQGNDPRARTSPTTPAVPPLPQATQPPPPPQQQQQIMNAPSGWNLQESHLAQPLHNVSRHRAGAEDSQHQTHNYGFDKETGGSTQDPMSPATPANPSQGSAPPPPRGRSSDLPPSSARRYPELFQQQQPHLAGQGPQQRPYGQPGGQPGGQPPHGWSQAPGQNHPSSGWRETQQDPAAAGSPSSEERGRRSTSALFKGIGDKFSRSGSGEENRLSGSHVAPPQGDEVSETSVTTQDTGATETKKKRASFLPSLRNRNSLDVSAPRQSPLSQNFQMQDAASDSDSAHSAPQSKKKGMFSAAAGYIPSGLGRSSTSNLNNYESNGGAPPNAVEGITSPPKKRFSALTGKAAGLAGRFQRSTKDDPNRLDTVPSNASDSPGQPTKGSISSSLFQHGRQRSDTTGSGPPKVFGMAPPPSIDPDHPEGRGRRGSFTGVFTGLWGSRSNSKSREPKEDSEVVLQQPQPPYTASPRRQSFGAAPHGQRQSEPSHPLRDTVVRQPSRTSIDFTLPIQQPSPLPRENPWEQGQRDKPVVGPHTAPQSKPLPAEPGNKKSMDRLTKGEQVSEGRPAGQESSVVSDGTQAKTQGAEDEAVSPIKRQPTPHANELLAMNSRPSGESPPKQQQQQQTPLPVVSPASQYGFEGRQARHQHNRNASLTNIPPQPQQQPQKAAQPDFQRTPVPGGLVGQQTGHGDARPQPGPQHQLQQQQQQQRQQQQQQQPRPSVSSQQSSPNLSRYSGQSHGQGQASVQNGNNNMGPTQSTAPTQPAYPPMVPTPQAETQGSRWKGIKNKFSGQAASGVPVSSQEKPHKQDKADRSDKIEKTKAEAKATASKVFGALKRAGKPSDPSHNQVPNQQSQWRPTVVQQEQYPASQWTGRPQQGPQSAAQHPQYQQQSQQQQRQPQHTNGAPPGQYPYSAAHWSQPQQSQQGKTQQGQQPQHTQQQPQGQPGPGQHHPGYNQAQWSVQTQMQQQQLYQRQQQLHQNQMHKSYEHQYGQVPIPQGYNAVHSEGQASTAGYNAGRHAPSQSPPPHAQHFDQGQQHNQGQYNYAPQQGHYAQPQYQHQHQPQPHNPAAQPPTVTSPPLMQSSGNWKPPQQTSYSPPIAQGQYPQQTQSTAAAVSDTGRPGPSRNMSLLSNESGVLGNPVVNEERSRSQTPQQRSHPEPASSVQETPRDTPRETPQATPPNEKTEQQSNVEGPVRQVSARTLDPPSIVSRSSSVGTEPAVEEAKAEQPRSTTPTVTSDKPKDEEENIYDASPRVNKDVTGGSHTVSEVSKSNTGEDRKPDDEPTRETIHAELADTNDARMRTLRLNSQEEKIFYDPEGDVPKMSATSYPGQEWVPDFADWRDGD